MSAQDVITLARSQVGYREGRSADGHWNNVQKYSGEVPGLGWSNGFAWCAVFASWLFHRLGIDAPITAACATGVAWWKARHRWSEYPAIGAQVFFGAGGGVHTGVVIAYDTVTITTIEGNTNDSGSAEGNGVYIKTRHRRDPYVCGYGYPAYPEGITSADPAWQDVSTVPAPPADTVPVVWWNHLAAATVLDSAASSPTGTIHYGDGPDGPKAVEQALVKLGYNPGPIDGSLGTRFRAAYSAWQRSLGYTGADADGIPGESSLRALATLTGLFKVA